MRICIDEMPVVGALWTHEVGRAVGYGPLLSKVLVCPWEFLTFCVRGLGVLRAEGRQRVKLYVGNISYHATETDLQEWFEQAGFAPDSVSVVRDRMSGESRGFGFVEMPDDVAGEAITSLNGKDCLGRSLVINEARPMRSRDDRGGGGGEGRRGGGGRGGGARW